MNAWEYGKKTAAVWATALLMLAALAGCSPDFTDQQCDRNEDCFPGEVCSSAGLCIMDQNGGSDTGLPDTDLPDISTPDTSVPDTTEPDTTEPDVIEPPEDITEDTTDVDEDTSDVDEDTSDVEDDTTEPAPIASVEVAPESATVKVGLSVRLTATAIDEDGLEMDGELFDWFSSDEDIATVDEDGEVTGVDEGDVTITVVSQTDDTLLAEATITVIEAEGGVVSVEVEPAATELFVGETAQLSATAFDVDDNEIDNVQFIWTVPTGTTSVEVDPDTGLVTALAYDADEPVVTVTANAEGVEGSATVEVLRADTDRVEITTDDPNDDLDNLEVAEGQSIQLVATAYDDNDNELTDRGDATWESSDEDIATIDEDGLLTGVAEGVVEITAEIDGISASIEITVVEGGAVNPPPSADAGGPYENVLVGTTVQLDGSASMDHSGTNDDLTFYWEIISTPPDSAAQLDDETSMTPSFDADEVGMYTVELTVTDADNQSDSVEVSIIALDEVSYVIISKGGADDGIDELEVEVGQTKQVFAIAFDDDDFQTGGHAETWSSDDEDVATVSQDGEITGVSEGTATITVEVGGETASIEVTVVAATGEPPTADAGTGYSGFNAGDTIQLDGSASEDSSGSNSDLTYLWEFTDVPVGSVAEFDDETSMTPSFVADKGGVYYIELTVTDADSRSATDSVSIFVQPDVDQVDITTDGGPNGIVTTLTLEVDDEIKLYEYAVDDNGELVSGRSVTWSSSDEDVVTVDTDGNVTAISEGVATVSAEVGGVTGSVEITVTDAGGGGNTPPSADAGGNQTVEVGQPVDLDASNSSDAEDDYADLTFAWEITSAPSASTATLSDEDTDAATFTPDEEGEYVITLTVTDTENASDTDTVTITVVDEIVVGDDCLIISQYVHKGNTRAIEIYNCGTDTVDLEDYMICGEQNAWNVTETPCESSKLISLSDADEIEAGDVIVVGTTDFDNDVPDVLDIVVGINTMQFNGDDRVIIFKDENGNDQFDYGIDTVMDVFGQLGVRPSSTIWGGTGYDRCNFTPNLGEDPFDVSDYYNTVSNTDFSGFGVPPVEDCDPD